MATKKTSAVMSDRTAYGSVKIYIRHASGCAYTDPGHDCGKCSYWVYEHKKNHPPRRYTLTTPSKSEAWQLASDILKGFDPEVAQAREAQARREKFAMPVLDAIDLFLNRRELDDSASTRAQYRSMLGYKDKNGISQGKMLLALERAGIGYIQDVSTAWLMKWYQGTDFSVLAPTTRRQRWLIVRTCFRLYEGTSPAGSHKPNTAVAQAYYNKQAGIHRLATETGAGQWGSALALACRMFGLECTVYMVKVSYEQKPYRRMMMNVWGAEVFASPSQKTNSGREILRQAPDSPGSLGIAISEAVEDAATHPDTNYSLGSVLNHVLLHQTVIGQEAKRQMALAGETPDVIIGCFGGGSNFGGIALPYVPDRLNGSAVRLLAVEPLACPSLTKGSFAYDFGDTAKLTPLVKMYTLGHDFIPASIHAGGLRYHGASPLASHLFQHGVIEARAYPQNPVFDAALQFARTEGILPAPEASHAIRAAIDEALAARAEGRARTILFCLSGHGHFDLSAYDAFLSGKLEDYEYPADEVRRSIRSLPVTV